ncbi:MAG: site-specific tyrosine recombinase XerD [Gemmatimonadaceae bacterium]
MAAHRFRAGFQETNERGSGRLRARNHALIDRYINVRTTGLGRASVAAYRADLLDFARFLDATSLLDATADEVATWFSTNLRAAEDPDDKRRWGSRTAHRRRASLRRFYEWARRQQLIESNPLESIELPRYYREPPIIVEPEHIARLLTFAESRSNSVDRPLAALALLDLTVLRLMERLALRVSEAVGIRLSQVRPAGSELQAWIMKKGNKPKIYPLAGVVLEAYARWLRIRRTIESARGHEDFVFVDPRTGRRITRQLVWARLKRLGAAAGLPTDAARVLSPHKLRHARARAMLQQGWDIATVQSVLDHASIQTTQVYVEASEIARLQALRRLSGPVPHDR